jgi:hypothetical protein
MQTISVIVLVLLLLLERTPIPDCYSLKYALAGEQIGGWYSILEARYQKEYIALIT